MERFARAIARLALHADKLAWAAVVGMMALVVFNCISRRVGLPIYGTYDYVGFLLIVLVVPALASCAVRKGHIYLSMVTDHLPQKAQLIIDIAVSTISFIFFGALVWALCDRAIRTYESGLTGMTSPIPVWPFIVLEAIAILFLCLVYLAEALDAGTKLRGSSRV